MKKFIRMTALLLVLLLVLPLAVACKKDNNGDAPPPAATTTAPSSPITPGNTKYADIAGEYLLDASSFGMTDKHYIRVSSDGNFSIGTDRTYATLEGDGTIDNSGDAYMFVYSDSTNENPKTATFKFEGVNMVFSTSVSIGTQSVSPNEEENLYPIAKKIVHEDILGIYTGTLNKTTGTETVPYTYKLVLGYGLEYTFAYTMIGQTTSTTLTESGTFDVDGNGKITFKATIRADEAVENPTAVEGTIADKKIVAPFKLSAMASEPDSIELTYSPYADVAGTYKGEAVMPVIIDLDTELVLDALGNYKYKTTDPAQNNAVQYTDEGTFKIENGKLILMSNAEGAEPIEATIADSTITARLRISNNFTPYLNLTFYYEAVSG